jgi:dipeptidase D
MNPKTREILDLFQTISTIPRCSKKEDKIVQWIEQWAGNRRLQLQKDTAGNLKITLAATAGYENAPGIVFQGHMDMVCEKILDSSHNFSKDPIRLVYDGDWLHADGTTLGADNGIAVAMGLALAADGTMDRPRLEILLTRDEETGLNGAKLLGPGFIDGKILLNADSETEGVFTVGCAGGMDTHIDCTLKIAELAEDWEVLSLAADGLRGGHSGIDIHRHRANALKVLARSLHRLKTTLDLRLVSIKGGTAHNAIPRDAAAIIACESAQLNAIPKMISEFEQILKSEYASSEENLALSLNKIDTGSVEKMALSFEETDRVINLLLTLPHGVKDMSAVFDNLVETSSNLAKAEIRDGTLHVVTSQRSSVASRLNEITASVEAAAALAGAATRVDDQYPAWQPEMESALLQRCKTIYRTLYNQDPLVQAIHAGLECGIIGSKYPGMDMISFGATIENAHSPDERLHIPSIERVWTFLTALLKSFQR